MLSSRWGDVLELDLLNQCKFIDFRISEFESLIVESPIRFDYMELIVGGIMNIIEYKDNRSIKTRILNNSQYVDALLQSIFCLLTAQDGTKIRAISTLSDLASIVSGGFAALYSPARFNVLKEASMSLSEHHEQRQSVDKDQESLPAIKTIMKILKE